MGQAGDSALRRYTHAKNGISKTRVSKIKTDLGCTDEAIARIAGVRRSTFLARASRGGFNDSEVNQLLRIEELIAEARDILDDTGDVQAWLRRPNRSLGGLVPQDKLNNPSGAEAVHGVLRRIRYGVHA